MSIYSKTITMNSRDLLKKLVKVHPFYGLSSGNQIGFKSDISVEKNFISVSPSSVSYDEQIKVLVVGGSVAAHLSLERLNIKPNLLARRLNELYSTNRFVYNAAFGGGKQPQQLLNYFISIY